jgi:hypothetical protein
MEHISKTNKISLLESLDINEMPAYVPGKMEKKPWEDDEEGTDKGKKEKLSKAKPGWLGQVDPRDPNRPAPDFYLYNPTKTEEGVKTGIVTLGEAEAEQFIQTHGKFMEWLNKTTNNRVHLLNISKTHYDPAKGNTPKAKELQSLIGNYGETEGKPISVKEKILRGGINPILRKYLATPEVNEHLKQSGYPPINMPDQFYKNQKAAIDRYSKVSNEEVNWGGHNYAFYNSVPDFAKASQELLFGDDVSVPVEVTHMPRQFNPRANWSPLRPTQKMDVNYKENPLTPILKLPKRGFREEDRDVAVSNSINVKGVESDGENGTKVYTWTVQFSTGLGKKLQDDVRLNDNGLIEDKNFTATERTEPMESVEGPDGSIASNPIVMDSLKKALESVNSQIMSIDPEEELIPRTRVDRNDLTRKVDQ